MKSIDFRNILPKGSVLVFSLLILSIMLVTSLTILSSAVLDRKASLSTGSSARSFQVADSGVEEVLYQIYKGTGNSTLSVLAGKIPGAVCDAGKISFPVAGGEAVVGFYQDETTIYADGCGGPNDDWRDKVVKIKSEGTAGPTTRAVEVAVAAAGGGVTGGCHIYMITSGGDKYISDRWGSGCKNIAGPIVIGGAPNCQSGAYIDSAYSCGITSERVESGGEFHAFCICMEK